MDRLVGHIVRGTGGLILEQTDWTAQMDILLRVRHVVHLVSQQICVRISRLDSSHLVHIKSSDFVDCERSRAVVCGLGEPQSCHLWTESTLELLCGLRAP